MVITLAAQVHCPQSQAQELQTKVESSLLRGRQETRGNTLRSGSSVPVHSMISDQRSLPSSDQNERNTDQRDQASKDNIAVSGDSEPLKMV